VTIGMEGPLLKRLIHPFASDVFPRPEIFVPPSSVRITDYCTSTNRLLGDFSRPGLVSPPPLPHFLWYGIAPGNPFPTGTLLLSPITYPGRLRTGFSNRSPPGGGLSVTPGLTAFPAVSYFTRLGSSGYSISSSHGFVPPFPAAFFTLLPFGRFASQYQPLRSPIGFVGVTSFPFLKRG